MDIEKFGKMIDKMLTDMEVNMLITMPEGTLDAAIKSPFSGTAGPTVDFYILLQALITVVRDLTSYEGPIDPNKLENMVDALLELVKREIMGGAD